MVTAASGWVTEEQAEAMRTQLIATLKEDGADAATNDWELWQYNPPFTIPFLR